MTQSTSDIVAIYGEARIRELQRAYDEAIEKATTKLRNAVKMAGVVDTAKSEQRAIEGLVHLLVSPSKIQPEHATVIALVLIRSRIEPLMNYLTLRLDADTSTEPSIRKVAFQYVTYSSDQPVATVIAGVDGTYHTVGTTMKAVVEEMKADGYRPKSIDAVSKDVVLASYIKR